MRFRTKSGDHGSVTVVLTMLLVPMVVVAGVFVDGGRGHLTRSVVRSAEQLALNDTLAQHDAQLSKMLGLLAVIENEGLSANADAIVRASLDGGGEGGDILQVGVSGSTTVTPVANANLAQPKVLANQMVEFMKYRAPINFMGELVESLEWLKTLKTNMEMVRARIQYLSKVTKVVEEATDLLKQVDATLKQIDTLLVDIDAMVDLLTGDPDIVQIYRNAFELVLKEEAGEDVTSAQKNAVSQDLKRVVTTYTNLRDGLQQFIGQAKDIDPSALVDAIKDLKGSATTDLKDKISAHESVAAGGADNEDVAGARGDIATTEALVEALEEAIKGFSDEVMNDLEKRVSDFVTNFEDALTPKLPDFTKITSYDRLKNFGRDYLDGYLAGVEDASSPEAIQSVLNSIRADIDAAVAALRTEIQQEVEEFVRGQVRKAFNEAKKELGALLKEEVGEGGLDILKDFFDLLSAKWEEYSALFEDLATQSASPELGEGGGGAFTESDAGKNLGTVSDKDSLSSSSDEAIGGIIEFLTKISKVLENVRDAALISEYVVGQFTFSTVEHENKSLERLTKEPLCAEDNCATEAEYVLTGMNSAVGAYGLVFLVRLSVNLITAFRDPVVTAIRTAISAIPLVGTALAFVVPVLAAVMQSVDDLTKLHAGAKLPLYSPRLTMLDPDSQLGGLVGSVLPDGHDAGGGGGGDDDAPSGPSGPGSPGGKGSGGGGKGAGTKGPELSYKNYLEIFLIVTTFIDQEGVVKRTGNLVQFNMGYAGSSDFRLDKAVTAFTVSTEYQMKPLVSTFFSYDAGGKLFDGESGRKRLTTVGGF